MVGVASSGDPLVYGIVQQFCGTQRATFLWQLVREQETSPKGRQSVWFSQRQMANILSCQTPNAKTRAGGHAHRDIGTVASVVLNNVDK